MGKIVVVRFVLCWVYIIRGLRQKSPNNHVLQSLKSIFILANRAGPDEMPRFAAFHLGFPCLAKYLVRAFQHTKQCHTFSEHTESVSKYFLCNWSFISLLDNHFIKMTLLVYGFTEFIIFRHS